LVGAGYRRWATDSEVTAEALLRATDRLGSDVLCTLTDLSVEAADFGQKLIWPEHEAACPDRHDRRIKSLADYATIEPLDPRRTPRMSEHLRLCDRLVQARGNELPLVAFVFGPLGVTSMLRDQAAMYMDLHDDPAAVLACATAINETLIDYCTALAETGVHAIMLDTLFASASIMSKQMWLEMEGPLVRRLAEHIHSLGCMVMIHNCGQGIYFDAQIETMHPEAISFLYPADDCDSLAATKLKYGHQTTLIGAVSPTWIVSAPPEAVEAECMRQIDAMGAGGGFILATGCEYPANLTLDRAEAMVRAARTYGVYDQQHSFVVAGEAVGN
jgi:uroporphyrinogen decarboxylase